MPDYKRMYLLLFNAAVESIDHLRSEPHTAETRLAITSLVNALQRCEEIYVESSMADDQEREKEPRKLPRSSLPPIRIFPQNKINQ